jgi:hypothetical protein
MRAAGSKAAIAGSLASGGDPTRVPEKERIRRIRNRRVLAIPPGECILPVLSGSVGGKHGWKMRGKKEAP